MNRRRGARWLAVAAVLGTAAAVRLEPWPIVYGSDRTSLVGDWDPHYHVLRAERWHRGAEGAPWRDPALNWPNGADVPWPPLFDALILANARAWSGPDLDREAIARTAAPIPVVLGVLLVLLVLVLARGVLGEGRGWIAALLVAVLPAGAIQTRLGRVDQHGLEQVLFCALLLAFLGSTAPRRRPALAAAAFALLVTVAFWSWMGSAIHLLVPLATAAAAWIVLPGERDRTRAGLRALAGGGLGGAALLAVTVLLLGRPGALLRTATVGVGGLQVVMAAAAGAFAAGLLLLERVGPAHPGAARRAVEVVAAALGPAAVLVVHPGIREGIAGGLTALTAGNPWYANIEEFQPLLNLGRVRPEVELGNVGLGLGLAPVAVFAGAIALRRVWRERAERRLELLCLAAAALFVVAWFWRRRFGAYAIVPTAIATEAGVQWLAAAVAARVRPAVARAVPAVLLAAVVAPTVPEHLARERTAAPAEEAALRWLAEVPPEPGREAVLAPWTLGHAVQYYARRPVVTSPFGTEGGAHVMEDEAAFWFATDAAQAEAVLDRRRCGFVLLTSIVSESVTLHGFAPRGTPAPFDLHTDLLRGLQIADTDAFWQTVPVRLYFADGSSTERTPALAAFRLVLETPRGHSGDSPFATHWMVFQRVAGATLEIDGAAGPVVRADTEFQTNVGRRSSWTAVARVDARGRASLRVPFASGWNGAVYAREWTISDGSRMAKVVVHEADVLEGRSLPVSLLPASARR